MKTCPACHTDITDDTSRFCPNCGAPLRITDNPYATPSVTDTTGDDLGKTTPAGSGFARPGSTGTESGGFARPGSTGTESGGFARPGSTGTESGGFARPGSTGTESGGFARPGSTGTESGGFARPGSTGTESGGFARPGSTGTGSGGYNSTGSGAYGAPQSTYTGYTPYQPPVAQPSGGLAIAALICSFFLGIVGLILGIVGLNQYPKGNGYRTMCIVAIIIPIVWMALSVIMAVFGGLLSFITAAY